MLRKRIAAFALAGCLLTNSGCFGLFDRTSSGGGCCWRGWGSRCSGSTTSAAVSIPVSTVGSGLDCPCSNHGGGNVFHSAVMSQGGIGMGGADAFSGATPGSFPAGVPIQTLPGQSMPAQILPAQPFPPQPAPMTTTPGVPVPPSPVGQPPRIQPVPMSPTGAFNVPASAPGGVAAPAPWGGQ